MFFINKSHFKMVVNNAVDRAIKQDAGILMADAALEVAQELVDNSMKVYLERAAQNIPEKIEREVRAKVNKKYGAALAELTEETGRLVYVDKWWESWPYSETIGTEAFIDMLVERINKKQVHPGL